MISLRWIHLGLKPQASHVTWGKSRLLQLNCCTWKLGRTRWLKQPIPLLGMFWVLSVNMLSDWSIGCICYQYLFMQKSHRLMFLLFLLLCDCLSVCLSTDRTLVLCVFASLSVSCASYLSGLPFVCYLYGHCSSWKFSSNSCHVVSFSFSVLHCALPFLCPILASL